MIEKVVSQIVLSTRQRFFAEGLRSLLNPSAEFHVTAVVTSPEDLMTEVYLHKPAIALLDLSAGVAVATIRDLRRITNPVLWGEPETMEFALQALDYGIRGIIPAS